MGVENLSLESSYDSSNLKDENFAETTISKYINLLSQMCKRAFNNRVLPILPEFPKFKTVFFFATKEPNPFPKILYDFDLLGFDLILAHGFDPI